MQNGLKPFLCLILPFQPFQATPVEIQASCSMACSKALLSTSGTRSATAATWVMCWRATLCSPAWPLPPAPLPGTSPCRIAEVSLGDPYGQDGTAPLKRDSRNDYHADAWLSGLTDIPAFSSRLTAQFYFSWMRRSRDPRGDTCRCVKAVLCKTAGSRGSVVAVTWGARISKCSPSWYSENMLTDRGQILTQWVSSLTS